MAFWWVVALVGLFGAKKPPLREAWGSFLRHTLRLKKRFNYRPRDDEPEDFTAGPAGLAGVLGRCLRAELANDLTDLTA